MKPNDLFTYIKTNAFSPDVVSLSQCYQPIIGFDALALYYYFYSFSDQGQGRFKWASILNHMDFGMNRLEKALDVLTAMELLELYRADELTGIAVQAPLTVKNFLAKPLYKNLLAKKIGEASVDSLLVHIPKQEQNISKNFSQVFTMDGQVPLTFESNRDFDWSAFKALMAKDKLYFQDETEDIIALSYIAEQAGWTWLETYRQAKITAIGHTISTKRLQQSRQSLPKEKNDLTGQERAIVREAKSKSSLVFLSILKDQRKATITMAERKCLTDLANIGLLDEVINILILYTFNKVDSANLNEKYAMKLGNDFSYKGIGSAEAAVLYLRELKTGQAITKLSQPQKSNVPEWSKEEVVMDNSPEAQARMEALRKRMLENESKGGS
ncbi:replication initiation/membrane attachment protein [Streptococcus suis]|uniref:replication initiation/membrane attachment protein n=1 Tax=Streptococcus suis TaxID=1307 RepID=UPI001C975AD3|nr:replication initiation/membrane attachment protein [Streptococcus suis]MBY5010677.1 replication initiation/membrane attachment protein [Streptococcus suis]MDG4519093.1 replication initiation/membrane attachment protein [Streptococcus suis]HEM6271315.1 replication initiation/membrane attachment protein [Streptococcus suis]